MASWSSNYALARAAHRKAGDSMHVTNGGGVGQYLIRARAALPGVEIDSIAGSSHPADAGRELVPDATFHADDGCFDRTYDSCLQSSSLQNARDWGASGLLAAPWSPEAFCS